MCGFAAFFQPGNQFSPDLLAGVGRDLFHRGPDAGAVVAESGVALVFRRLAIIDPSQASDQPMTDATGRFTIVFNGEIYNYRDLRRDLQAEGVTFATNGDTEVLLQGFIAWGERIFERLEGMFATVIVDRQARRAVVARDPFGIKPLYRLTQGSLTALASEMRPLLRLTEARPDPLALGELLSFRFAGGRRSNLQGIEKVPGGTLLRIDLHSGHVEERRYLDVLDTHRPDDRMTEADALELAEAALLKSVRQHLESDVGYTLQLSGGVDSSLISALAARESGRRLTSFAVSLGSDHPLDEGRWRNAVIERYGFEHHDVFMGEQEFADGLPEAIAAMEGPSAHFGCVMLMLLCRRIRQSGKVVLTGEGADEMFGGYQRYELWRQLRRMGALASLVPAAAWPLLRRYDGVRRYAGRDAAIYSSCYHNIDAMAALFPGLVPAHGSRAAIPANMSDFRSRMLASDQTVYLESLLMRQDKMAMSASVEARVPFTHLPLARVVNTIPHRLRVPGGQTKPLLKRIAEKYLPAEVIHRRKVGLTLPIDAWLANSQGLGRYLDLLDAADCRLAAYGDHKAIRRAVSAFRDGKGGGSSLALLINVELWLRSLATH